MTTQTALTLGDKLSGIQQMLLGQEFTQEGEQILLTVFENAHLAAN